MWLGDIPRPIIIASGTQSYDIDPEITSRVGATTLKSIKPLPTAGNPPPRIAEVKRKDILEILGCPCQIEELADRVGMVNSIGLQQPGVDAFIAEYIPQYENLQNPRIIASIAGNSIDEYVYVLLKLNLFDKLFMAYEINVSCPNTQEGMLFGQNPTLVSELVSMLKKLSPPCFPLIVKLTPNTDDICAVAGAALEAGADGLSLINTILVKARMRDGRVIQGGLSGPIIRPVAQRLIEEVCTKFPSVPVIAGGGVWNIKDVFDVLAAGATAVSVGTLNLKGSKCVLELVSQYEKIKNYFK